MKLGLKGTLGVLISALLIWWTLRGESLPEIWEIVRTGNFWLLGASVFVATAGFLLRAMRWRVLLHPLKADTSLDSRFGAITIGFMANNLLPARMGEFVRVYAFSRMESVSMSGAFGTLVLERMLDGVVLLVFLLLPLMLPGFPGAAGGGDARLGGLVQGILLVMLVLVVFLALLVIWPTRVVRTAERLLVRLPRNAGRRAVAALESFLEAIQVVRSPRLLLQAVVWSFVFWSWHGISFWLAMAAFGIREGFAAAIFTEAAVGFGVAIPSAPGFFGTFHAAAAWALEDVYGVEAARALAFAYGYHLGGFIPVTLIGLWYARRMGLSLKDMGRREGQVAPDVENARPDAAELVRPGDARPREDQDEASDWARFTMLPGGRTVRLRTPGVVEIDAPAKVNLVLTVLEKEPSGYHGIETLFQSLELADRIRVELTDRRGVELEVTGLDAGPPEQNLVRRAAEAYLSAARLPLGVRIHLEKRIPAGAGLGGGSSDAAATLRALDSLIEDGLAPERLVQLAAELGSDVPFFLCGSALAIGQGRGERLSPLAPLGAAPVILALPAVHVSTGAAYHALDQCRSDGTEAPRSRADGPPPSARTWEQVARLARNDFETVVLRGNPLIAQARAALLETDPSFALLSGSGSAVFALYPGPVEARRALAALGEIEGVRFLLTRTREEVPALELARTL